MSKVDFIVHESADNVGVIVVENIKKGEQLNGWLMATDETLSIAVNHDIPIGHKIAIKPLQSGDAAIKYGEDIGRMVASATVGDHVHTHNLKTKRW